MEITFDNNSSKKINYIYNAAGVKLKKTVTDGTTITTTDYLNGFQYVDAVLEFFPTTEGYVKNTVVSGSNNYNYVFHHKDHLGNVRVSYSVDPADGLIKILEENHYYPFGLKHESYSATQQMIKYAPGGGISIVPIVSPSDLTYNFRYNGKEEQKELGLNMYDYGARNYDAAIGRWMNVDPLAEKFIDASPYNYCTNNPVVFVDPDGMDVQSFSGEAAIDAYNSIVNQMDAKSDHTIVTKTDDGKYKVVGGKADSDRGVYLDDGKGGKGKKVGTSMTTHSFFNDNNKPVLGAIIDPNSTEGQDFLNMLEKLNPNLFYYMARATGNKEFDFKKKGIENSKVTDIQHLYRGSISSNGEFGSARDFGNYSAGFIAGRNGISWVCARLAFDALETFQKTRWGSWGGLLYPNITPKQEGLSTIKAQSEGFHDARALYPK